MGNLRDELEKIRKQAGELKPEPIVEAATPEDHPLHSRFEWDNSIAGHQYRLEQARMLIRQVRIEFVDSKEKVTTIRAYQAVRNEKAPGYTYVPSEEVAASPVLTDIVLMDMKREWKALQQRYGHFAEFVSMIQSDIA